MNLKKVIASQPIAQRLYRLVSGSPLVSFETSSQYWEDRYASGGNSGFGSYGNLAVFKAEVLNGFVAEHGVESVLEFGCGDGSQLELARYPHYIGVDVSRSAVSLCRDRFRNDPGKRFFVAGADDLAPAEMTLSLDVIYHLIEDDVFHLYMRDLFAFASRFVCIYSSNHERAAGASHVRHRRFENWIEANAPQWSLLRKIDNPFPFDSTRPKSTSFADFYFFASNIATHAAAHEV